MLRKLAVKEEKSISQEAPAGVDAVITHQRVEHIDTMNMGQAANILTRLKHGAKVRSVEYGMLVLKY